MFRINIQYALYSEINLCDTPVLISLLTFQTIRLNLVLIIINSIL